MTTCSDSSTLDPSVAVDRAKVNTKIRFLMGGVSTTSLPDTILTTVLEDCILKFEDSQVYECDITYCTLLDSLNYLIRQSWTDIGADVRGNLKRTKEKEGGVAYEDEYESSGLVATSGWEKLYDYFLNNPSEICPCLEVERTDTYGLINIGGTKQDKYIETENAPNNKAFWGKGSVGSKFSARRESRRRQSFTRSKYYK